MIHANWWMRVVELPVQAIEGKPVVCHMVGEVVRVMAEPMFARALERVTPWCAPSRAVKDYLERVVDRVWRVPYAIDPLSFERAEDDAEVRSARAQLPRDEFVVASVHRDTAGAGITSNPVPKLDKGPDAWVEVLAALHDRGVPAAALLAELGWRPVRPTMIRNAADPEVFFAATPRERDASAPVRVIKPLGIAALGELLRRSDVYISASRNDPCSNALVEALSCGLPALYYDGGGHPELAGFGGLRFTRAEQVPMLLDRLMGRYDAYRPMIRVDGRGRAS